MNDVCAKLVLASASPRRLALLNQIDLAPDLMHPTNIDEEPRKRETPRALALRLAKAKAEAAGRADRVRELGPNTHILAADTIVTAGRRIVPKPARVEDVAAGLRLLSGRAHKVITGVCLIAPRNRIRCRLVETRVRFKRLTHDDIETYLTSDEWRDKAGGYGIQGRAAAFVQTINGSCSNVVGLPVHETVALLQGNGYPVYSSWRSAGDRGART